jgi:Phycobilisome protein
MNQILNMLFKEPDKRYLTPQELGQLSQYVSSLPERIKIYRQLREQETKLMQAVVDQLSAQHKSLDMAQLGQSAKQAILILRYSAMAMLSGDQELGARRLADWLPTMVEAYQTQTVDELLYPILHDYLARIFPAPHLALLKPALESAQKLLTAPVVISLEDAPADNFEQLSQLLEVN